MKKKNRVLFFKPLFNWILGHSYIVLLLIFIVLAIIFLPFLKKYAMLFLCNYKITLSPFQENILSGLIVTAIPSSLTVICYLIKSTHGNSRRIKRKMYNIGSFLYRDPHVPTIIKKVISYLVNLFYFHNRELIESQQYVIDNILESLTYNISTKKRIYWIEGSSYSGKTTTILNLLIDLISKNEYNQLFQKLDGNIIYFDLGKPGINIENLKRYYESEKFSNCLIIIDNLHMLSGKSCFDILESIVLHNHAFALIILLRHPEEFLSENDRVTELKRIMHDNGTDYLLRPLMAHDFEISHEDLFIKFCKDFFPIEQIIANNEIAIHLYMIFLKREYDMINLLQDIRFFLKDGSDNLCSISSELIAIISCSLFTGCFNLDLLLKCQNEILEWKWKRLLKELTKIGFLTNYPNSVNDFYFHEKIAKFYFKITIRQPKYNEIYLKTFEKLSHEFISADKSVFTFLYCMLAQKVSKAKNIFGKVVTNSNFINLHDEMTFLFNQKICDISDYYKEMGILCDRCGKLYDARRFYSLYLDAEKNPDAFYKLVQINHKIIDKYPYIKAAALNSSDIYINGSANYWEIHINMHHGIFQFQALFNLAIRFEENADYIINAYPYDGIHLLRRLYFDVFRLYYLEGIFKPELLKQLVSSNSKIYRILKNALEEFEAYYIKFAIGLMLGQDILFSLAFENKGLNLSEYSFLFKDYINLDHSRTYDYKAIANETIRIYSKAIELFEKMGDKTAIFVKYHMYNIKMLLIDDGDFTECERFYEDYMVFAVRENILEYQAYAETFKLKMTLIQLCSPAIITTYGNDQYEELKNVVRQKLELVQKYEELATPGFGNQYASLRLKIYSALFSYFTKEISTSSFRNEIEVIKTIAQSRKYNRELKIIKYIEKYSFKLSPESIRIIVSFYPIVPQ